MTITLIDSSSRADNFAKTDTLENTNDRSNVATGPGFGQVMQQMLQTRQETGQQSNEQLPPTAAKDTEQLGQELAAAIPIGFEYLPIHHPDMAIGSLKAVDLGPTLKVITSEQAVPDAQSLEAFARSQGLDENAVQWLMGKPLEPLPSSLTEPDGRLDNLAVNTPSWNLSQITGLNLKMGVTNSAAATPVNPETGPGQGTDVSAPPTGTAAVLTLASSVFAKGDASWAMNLSAPPTGTAAVLTLASSVFAKGDASWAMNGSGDSNPTSSGSPSVSDADSAETAAIQIQLLKQPTPAAVWIMRHAQPLETKADPASVAPSVSESELDLGAEFSPEFLDPLLSEVDKSQGPAPLSASPHPAATAGSRHEQPLSLSSADQTTGTAEDTASNAAQRSENIQDLAEKMGQAVGRRMLTEIEKGQWHLKLQLRPATLGHIEVEMRMLSGELDAVFNAPQALTRELLQEGMSRLKETLSQMGMDVASMLIKDGQTRQNGGKSTPNQASKSTDLVNNDSKSTNSPAITVVRQKMGEDGWDVLV